MKVKSVLIIYPHWPPSNLAGVHRARLISNFLPELGWKPIIITVHESYYEEKLDFDFLKTVCSTTEVHKVKAFKTKKNRVVGDIGIRGFLQMHQKAKDILRNRKIDFIWVPIPSYYTTLMLPSLHNRFKIPYGIDYIDPWVKPRDVLGKVLSKSYLSNIIAKLLEPYVLKKAALISGVNEAYYLPVLDRNFKKKKVVHVGMPYGFDPSDHQMKLDDIDLPWGNEVNALVYAGAFLPKSHLFLQHFFQVIKKLKDEKKWKENLKVYFLGTGTYNGKQIKEYALEYGISDIVTELNQRFPFLHILYFLNQADGVIVLGSTEKHYTASKIFQAILSKKPILPIFHHLSSAVTILNKCHANQFLVKYFVDDQIEVFSENIYKATTNFLNFKTKDWHIDESGIAEYSAQNSAKILVQGMEKVLQK